MRVSQVALPLFALRGGVELFALRRPLSPDFVTVLAIRFERHADVDPRCVVVGVDVFERGAQIIKRLRRGYGNSAALGQII